MEVALADLPKQVTNETNSFLDMKFTNEDVSEALAQMCPTKAPGSNSLLTGFF